MLFNKKMTVAVAILALVLAGIAAAKPPERIYKNLKVLPKDITHDELDKVMNEFKNSLGVRCNFCHAPSKTDPKKMDFASDDKHEKEIARDMMRMTLKLNKKYFEYKPKDTSSVAAIGCYSCHHGSEHPAKTAPKGQGGPGGQRPSGPPPAQNPPPTGN
jgi:cytochrome c553